MDSIGSHPGGESALFSFDDSLFEDTATVPRIAQSSIDDFHPNVVFPLDFLHDLPTHSAQTLKYKGDYFYYTGDYEKALEAYEQCEHVVPASNRTLQRDVAESKVWCLLGLVRFDKAKCCLRKFSEVVIAAAATQEQRTPAVFLNVHFCSACGDLDECEKALKQALSVHPLHATWWRQLADVYRAKSAIPPCDVFHEKRGVLQVSANRCPRTQRVDDEDKTIESDLRKRCSLARACTALALCLAQRNASHSMSFARIHFLDLCRQIAKEDNNSSGDSHPQFKEGLFKVIQDKVNTGEVCLSFSSFDETLSSWVNGKV